MFDSCHNDFRRAHIAQLLGERERVVEAHMRVVIDVGEDARLGDVGRDDVGMGNEFRHALAHLGCVGAVGLSFIAHNGVDERYAAVAAKFINEVAHDRNLLGRTEKSRAYASESQIEFAPLVNMLLHMGCEILETVAWKARVIAQDRCWQHAALHAQLRNNGQLHSDGTSSKAGDVVDESDLFLVIVVWGNALHGGLSVAVSERLAIIVVG